MPRWWFRGIRKNCPFKNFHFGKKNLIKTMWYPAGNQQKDQQKLQEQSLVSRAQKNLVYEERDYAINTGVRILVNK